MAKQRNKPLQGICSKSIGELMQEQINGLGHRLNETEKDLVRTEERTKINTELISDMTKTIKSVDSKLRGLEIKVAGIVGLVMFATELFKRYA